VTLVTALHRDDNTIAVYRLDPDTRDLVDVEARELRLGIGGYGSCMYRSPHTGRVYVFANSEHGEVEQWELLESGDGRVDARLVRSFDVGRQTEGCVADDELALLFIGEEAAGIWVYGAEPEDGTARRSVDTTGSGGHLREDVEGLALVYGPGGTGFLIASSQGDSTFAVYRREGANEYVGSFSIVDGEQTDGVSGTDGIDATTAPLGELFPAGVFVAQDGENEEENQNFKLVPLDELLG
jgi:3-phytase